MKPNALNRTERIRTLNDNLRRNFSTGQAVITVGVAALGSEAVARIIKTVEVFDADFSKHTPRKSFAKMIA
jgi:hypothetical protein